MDLPWVSPLLEQVQSEYRLPPPVYRKERLTFQEYEALIQLASEKDPFDTAGLKADTAKALISSNAIAFKTVCSLGEITVVSYKADPFHPPWKTWWRAVRLLSPTKPVKILVFGHSKKRLPPPQHTSLKAEHLNGGSAFRCNPQSIVIYRKEEATRVLIHELFHASCSDPYHKDTPQIEADTEAWAEILLCAMAAQGVPKDWSTLMRQQIEWSKRQAVMAKTQHHVCTEKDYGWRYLVGRLDVWDRLGLPVDSVKISNKPITSLRFSLCEPKNI
jgi:hypothetical protein